MSWSAGLTPLIPADARGGTASQPASNRDVALLIVEVFLASVLMAADLSGKLKATALYAGVGVLVLILIVVSLLV